MTKIPHWTRWVAVAGVGLALVVSLAFIGGRVRAWTGGYRAGAFAPLGFGGCTMSPADCPMFYGRDGARSPAPDGETGSPPGGLRFGCH